MKGLIAALFTIALMPKTSIQQIQGLPWGAQIQGIVRSRDTPIPGASLTASKDGGGIASGITDEDGTYRLHVAGPGRYIVTVSMTMFELETREVTVADASKPANLNFDLRLQSRITQPSGASTPNHTPLGAGPANSSIYWLLPAGSAVCLALTWVGYLLVVRGRRRSKTSSPEIPRGTRNPPGDG